MATIDGQLKKLTDPRFEKFKGQNFDEIRANCLSENKLWDDPKFEHDKQSLGKVKDKYKKDVKWKRVHDISSEARLFIKGHCEDDVIQGELGDCWFVASVASLALHDSLVKKVIPHSDQQELDREDYCGVLLFRFHRFGEWIEVVVDDYLPTIDNQLVFMHNHKPNEFWAAFLEKAYAKLDGSYGALIMGFTADALNDLTGGISERIHIDKVRKNNGARQKVYRQLKTALSRDSIVCLLIRKQSEEDEKSFEKKGLKSKHCYSVINCYNIPPHFIVPMGYKRELVKVRNPWGGVSKKRSEWKGRWGDDDEIWSKISEDVKKALNYKNSNDGEYWMDIDDFLDKFDDLTICRIMRTCPEGGENCWHQEQIRSEWVPGSTAGGCSNYLDTFFTNPQIQFQIEHEHDETVQIVLAQPDTRSDQDKKNMRIGLNIFKVPEGNNEKVDSKTEILELQAQGTMEHHSYRQLYKKFELDVGTYVIIPSTKHPNVEGRFLLRILTENEAHVKELED